MMILLCLLPSVPEVLLSLGQRIIPPSGRVLFHVEVSVAGKVRILTHGPQASVVRQESRGEACSRCRRGPLRACLGEVLRSALYMPAAPGVSGAVTPEHSGESRASWERLVLPGALRPEAGLHRVPAGPL